MKPESPTLQPCRMSYFSFSRHAVELPRTSVCLYAAHSTWAKMHNTSGVCRSPGCVLEAVLSEAYRRLSLLVRCPQHLPQGFTSTIKVLEESLQASQPVDVHTKRQHIRRLCVTWARFWIALPEVASDQQPAEHLAGRLASSCRL